MTIETNDQYEWIMALRRGANALVLVIYRGDW